MLATKQYFTSIYEWIYGPYVKNIEKVLAVETKQSGSRSVLSAYSLSNARAGISLGDMSVALVGDLQCLKVPSAAKVEILTYLGWKTLWDGSLAMPVSDTMDLVVSSNSTVRVFSQEQSITFGLRRGQDSGQSAKVDWRDTLIWGLRGIGSFIAHMTLFGLAFYLSGFELPWTSDTLNIDSLESTEKTQLVQLSASDLGGFDGRGMSIGSSVQGGGPSANAPGSSAKADARAKAMTSGLSGLAAKLANMNFGIGTLAVNTGGGDASKSMAAMQAGLSKGQGSSLNAGLEKVAQGVIGKNMKWGLFGSNGQSVSQRDQEEVANIFRALQPEFRNCYESALLRDSELSVLVNYEATIVETGTLDAGNFDVTGTATAEGQKQLTECLSGVLKKVRVGRSLNGVKIKNQFIFKS